MEHEAFMKLLNLPQKIHDSAKEHPQKSAVESQGLNLNYHELSSLSHDVCSSLWEIKISQGDRIGVFTETIAWAYPSLVGTLQAGAIYVPMNSEFPDARLMDIATDAQLSAILCESSLLERALTFKQRCNLPIELIILDESSVCLNKDQAQSLSQSKACPVHKPKPDELAYILYTSARTTAFLNTLA
jgi:non-ribosomal peptide synthetase component F